MPRGASPEPLLWPRCRSSGSKAIRATIEKHVEEESGRSLDNQAIIKAVYDRFATGVEEAPEQSGATPRPKRDVAERKRSGPARLEDISMSQEEFLRMLGD